MTRPTGKRLLRRRFFLDAEVRPKICFKVSSARTQAFPTVVFTCVFHHFVEVLMSESIITMLFQGIFKNRLCMIEPGGGIFSKA